jgi:hypothetical protein
MTARDPTIWEEVATVFWRFFQLAWDIAVAWWFSR